MNRQRRWMLAGLIALAIAGAIGAALYLRTPPLPNDAQLLAQVVGRLDATPDARWIGDLTLASSHCAGDELKPTLLAKRQINRNTLLVLLRAEPVEQTTAPCLAFVVGAVFRPRLGHWQAVSAEPLLFDFPLPATQATLGDTDASIDLAPVPGMPQNAPLISLRYRLNTLYRHEESLLLSSLIDDRWQPLWPYPFGLKGRVGYDCRQEQHALCREWQNDTKLLDNGAEIPDLQLTRHGLDELGNNREGEVEYYAYDPRRRIYYYDPDRSQLKPLADDAHHD